MRDFQSGVDIGRFRCLQRIGEVEVLFPQQRGAGGFQRRADIGSAAIERQRGSEIEFRFQLRGADAVAGVLGGQADHDILEFPYVAGKIISQPQRSRVRRQVHRLGAVLRRVETAEIIEQPQPVVAQIPQRWRGQGKDRQAMVQIGPELAAPYRPAQIPVSGGNNACPGLPGLGFADALIFAVLQYTQQLGLEVDGQLANFVEKERATARVLEVAGLAVAGAGKGPFRIAEQRGFDQRGRDGRAIEGEKRFPRARRQVMQGGGDQFLAAARFTFDQGGETGCGILGDLLPELLDRRAFAQYLRCLVLLSRDQLRIRQPQGVLQEVAQIGRFAGFGHQVDGAEGPRPAAVGLLVLAGEHKNLDVRRVGEQLTDQPEAFVGQFCHRWQAQVHQGESRWFCLPAQECDGLFAVRRKPHLKIARKKILQAFADQRIIVNDKQGGLAAGIGNGLWLHRQGL